MERWQRRSVIAGGSLLLGAAAFAWGFMTHRAQLWPYALLVEVFVPEAPPLDPTLPPGRWSTLTGQRPVVGKQLDSVREQLAALGYLDGTMPAPDAQGIVAHDTARAWPGLNVVVSAHAPEATVMRNDGTTLHRWALDYPSAFGKPFPEQSERFHYWRRVKPTGDGGLLALYPQLGVVRIDEDSQLVWRWEGYAHHDLSPAPGGTTWVLAREHHVIERVHPREPVLEDFIVVLDASGTEVDRVSVLEALERSAYAALLARALPYGDLFHTNAVQPVPEGVSFGRVRPGQALVSFRSLDAVAVIDLEAREVVWAQSGQWHRQHEPSLLPGPRLLVFDNASQWPRSRVAEFDVLTQELLWSYDGGERPFASKTCGTAHRLPNGNTLAVATDTGRAVEVTPSGEVVWEFISPHRAGEDDALVATLFDVFRVLPSALGLSL